MNTELTKKQRVFADEYINTGNAGLAAEKAYDVKNNQTARSMGSENLTKPNIREYIEEQAFDAMGRIVELSINATSEEVRLRANQDIVDRGGYKKAESVNLRIEQQELDDKDPRLIELANRYSEELREIYSS